MGSEVTGRGFWFVGVHNMVYRRYTPSRHRGVVSLAAGAGDPLDRGVEQLPPVEVDHDHVVHDPPVQDGTVLVHQLVLEAAEPAVHRPREALERGVGAHVHHGVVHRRHVRQLPRAGGDDDLVAGGIDFDGDRRNARAGRAGKGERGGKRGEQRHTQLLSSGPERVCGAKNISGRRGPSQARAATPLDRGSGGFIIAPTALAVR
jgi:hypothetical protein